MTRARAPTGCLTPASGCLAHAELHPAPQLAIHVFVALQVEGPWDGKSGPGHRGCLGALQLL